jgi:lysophospholipid acyltransferase (LPLAT)-like uncharacterized protein
VETRIPLKLRNSVVIKVVAFGFATAMWLLFRTLKLQLQAAVPEANPYDPTTREPFLYSVWHDSIVIPVFGGRHCRTTALTSQHADGSFVAQVLRFNRIFVIRGSTNRIRTGSLRELMRRAETQHLVLSPDGPRGPARCMSAGIAYLASRSGRAVVPTAYACSRSWRCRGSWTDLIIPKPFARVLLLAGEPIYIPGELKAAELQEYAAGIQVRMDRLHEQAEEQMQGVVLRRETGRERSPRWLACTPRSDVGDSTVSESPESPSS